MNFNIEQGTEEWFGLRRGRFTASMFYKLMSNKTTKGYNDVLQQVVFERLTGKTPPSYVNDAMLRGTELEPVARQDYVFTTNNEVEQVGFVTLDDWVGCSPDGLVGEHGLLEIKCPNWNTHLDYLLADKLPSIYRWQVQGQLYITGREWCDFYSYHPDLESFQKRVERNEKDIEELKERIKESIEEVQLRINKIKEKK